MPNRRAQRRANPSGDDEQHQHQPKSLDGEPSERGARRERQADGRQVQGSLGEEDAARKQQVRHRQERDRDPTQPIRLETPLPAPRHHEQRRPERHTRQADQEPAIQQRSDDRALGRRVVDAQRQRKNQKAEDIPERRDRGEPAGEPAFAEQHRRDGMEPGVGVQDDAADGEVRPGDDHPAGRECEHAPARWSRQANDPRPADQGGRNDRVLLAEQAEQERRAAEEHVLPHDRRIHSETHAGGGHQLGTANHVRDRFDMHRMDGKD